MDSFWLHLVFCRPIAECDCDIICKVPQEQPPVCFNLMFVSAVTWCYTPIPLSSRPQARSAKSFPLVPAPLHLSATLPSVSSSRSFIHPSIHPSIRHRWCSHYPSLPRLSAVLSLITAHPEGCCFIDRSSMFPLCIPLPSCQFPVETLAQTPSRLMYIYEEAVNRWGLVSGNQLKSKPACLRQVDVLKFALPPSL